MDERVLNNNTLYLHVFLTKSQVYRERVNTDLITSRLTSHAVGSITKHAYPKSQSYLLGKDKKIVERKSSEKPTNHWRPKMVVEFVSKPQTIPGEAISPEIAHLIK